MVATVEAVDWNYSAAESGLCAQARGHIRPVLSGLLANCRTDQSAELQLCAGWPNLQ